MKNKWIFLIIGIVLGAGLMYFVEPPSYSSYSECRLREMQKMPESNIASATIVSNYCEEYK